MPRDYSHNSPHYDVEMDASQVHADTMTDQGIPASELFPVEGCSLTPGDPSPLGRTEDGDLVYPEYPGHTYMRLERRQAAELAHVYAKAMGITEFPKPPFTNDAEILFMSLVNEALPRVFYEDSAHAEHSYRADLDRILTGRFETLEKRWKRPE